MAMTATNPRDDRLTAELRLVFLRQKLHEARGERRQAEQEFALACRAERGAVREQLRELRRRGLEDVRTDAKLLRGLANTSRLARHAELRRIQGANVAHWDAAQRVEREHQAALRRIEADERKRKQEIERAHELAAASDAVRSVLLARVTPVVERHGRRAVAPAPGESRGEAILRFAEQNPGTVHAQLAPSVHRKVHEREQAVAEQERVVRAVGGDVNVRPPKAAKLMPVAATPSTAESSKHRPAHGKRPPDRFEARAAQHSKGREARRRAAEVVQRTWGSRRARQCTGERSRVPSRSVEVSGGWQCGVVGNCEEERASGADEEREAEDPSGASAREGPRGSAEATQRDAPGRWRGRAAQGSPP